MTKTRQLPYGVEDEVPQRPKRIPPAFLTFLSVLFTVLAGLGDWKTLNDTLKGLPKAIALGVIVCAFFYFLVDADILNFKKAMSYFPVYMLLIAVYTVISMYIWVSDFSKFSSISRAGQKILFQIITIIYAICMCYLFEDRAIDYLFFSMCAANAGIMLLEIPKYGIAESISSVVTCIVTFGEAEGFVRALEIHDITFLFGQFFIYYMMFAPKETKENRIKRRLCVGLCLFFMLVGLKRSTLPAVMMMCVYVKMVRMLPRPRIWMMATGIALFLFFYLYLYLVRTGILVAFLESLGVDMMGRNTLWSLPNSYYELSPFWKGRGFEGVSDLVAMWVEAGILSKSFPLHNDILKLFIELGALGFTLWSGINYILYPAYWINRHDMETGLLYVSILCYMTVTYLTDNTALYFWSCVGLRLIPMSYSYRLFKAQKMRRWKPLSADEVANEIWLAEMGGNHHA